MNLKEINKYTLQEIFDYVTDKIIEQGEQSIEDDECLYINYKDGRCLHCAIGHLLTNDMVVEEGFPISYIINDNDIDISSDRLGLLKGLQAIHDGISLRELKGDSFRNAVKVLLKKWVAGEYKLECNWDD